MRDLFNYTTDSNQQSPDTARHHMTGEFLPVNTLRAKSKRKAQGPEEARETYRAAAMSRLYLGLNLN